MTTLSLIATRLKEMYGWRVFYYLNQRKCDNNIKEAFGFISRKCPPPCSNLISFKKVLSDMVKSLKFRDVKDSFQRELNEGIRKIRSSPTVYVFAGKTNNIYEMSKDHRQNLLHDNITKTYQKVPPKLEVSINLEAKSNLPSLKLAIELSTLQEHLLL